MSIGENIRTKRHALGLNQEELAEKLGLTQANISRMEANAKGPNAETLLAVADALGCDVRELMGVETKRGRPVRDLDRDVKTFVLNAIKSDPPFGMSLRNIAKQSDSLTEDDWKFLVSNLKLALGYAFKIIEARRLRDDG